MPGPRSCAVWEFLKLSYKEKRNTLVSKWTATDLWVSPRLLCRTSGQPGVCLVGRGRIHKYSVSARKCIGVHRFTQTHIKYILWGGAKDKHLVLLDEKIAPSSCWYRGSILKAKLWHAWLIVELEVYGPTPIMELYTLGEERSMMGGSQFDWDLGHGFLSHAEGRSSLPLRQKDQYAHVSDCIRKCVNVYSTDRWSPTHRQELQQQQLTGTKERRKG